MAIGISEELMTEAEAISDPCACTVHRPIIIPESSPPSTSPGTRTFPAPANTSQPTPAHVGSRHRFMPGRSVGTRERAEAAPDPSPDPSRSRRLVASSQPTGKPGQEVGRRARALTRWRWARAFLGAPTVARTPQRGGVKERRLGWRIHGGGWEDGWPASTNRAQTGRPTGQLGGFHVGPGEQQQLPNSMRLQRHHEAFFNGRAWNYLKIESRVLLIRLVKRLKKMHVGSCTSKEVHPVL
jgi:hypothetical protein